MNSANFNQGINLHNMSNRTKASATSHSTFRYFTRLFNKRQINEDVKLNQGESKI